MFVVAIREKASRQQWNPHRLQIIRANDVIERPDSFVVARRSRLPVNPEGGVVLAIHGNRAPAERFCFYAGRSGDSGIETDADAARMDAAGAVVHLRREGQVKRVSIVGIKAGIHGPQFGETADQQSCAGEQH